jgi:hypothetical protein
MSHNSIPISVPFRCAVLAFTLAVLSAAFTSVSSAQDMTQPTSARSSAAPTWTITIHATGSGQKPYYTVSPPARTGKCADPENPAPTAERLTVCAGDTVQWNVAPNGSDNLILYTEDSCLQDANGASQWFDSKAPIVATVNPHATAGEQHKYYVTVYDDPTKRLYVDDPKFIIGGGRRAGRVLLEDIETLKQDTEALHAKYPDNAAIQKLLDAVEAVKKSLLSEHEDKQDDKKHE